MHNIDTFCLTTALAVPGLTSSRSGGLSGVNAPPGGAAGTTSGAGGRGAGPDHRELRYQDGVLAMINNLRMLNIGGSRVWDHVVYQQVGLALVAGWCCMLATNGVDSVSAGSVYGACYYVVGSIVLIIGPMMSLF